MRQSQNSAPPVCIDQKMDKISEYHWPNPASLAFSSSLGKKPKPILRATTRFDQEAGRKLVFVGLTNISDESIRKLAAKIGVPEDRVLCLTFSEKDNCRTDEIKAACAADVKHLFVVGSMPSVSKDSSTEWLYEDLIALFGRNRVVPTRVQGDLKITTYSLKAAMTILFTQKRGGKTVPNFRTRSLQKQN